MRAKLAILAATTAVVLFCSPTRGERAMTIRDFAERDKRPVETAIYKQAGDQGLRLLVCKPDGWKPGKKHPAMVWIHGGGFTGGAPEAFFPHMKVSAARGAMAFGVQYRLMESSGYRSNKNLSDEENRRRKQARSKAFMAGPSLTDCIADCEDAMRYIRGHAEELGVDRARVSVIGDSAGAYLAACLGTLSKGDARPNAVIACSSISDLTTGFGPAYVKPGEDAKALSPCFSIPGNAPPCLILHGANDWLKDEPKRFCEALQGKGVDCEYTTYPTGKHAFIVYNYSATLEEMSRALLDMDAFLLKRGLLDGPTTIAMPDYAPVKEIVAEIADAFNEKRVLEREGDFPGFLTIELQVNPAATFTGTLFDLTGTYGCRYTVDNRGHDFTALRMRQRGKQIVLQPEVWQHVRVSLAKERVVITVGDQRAEIANELGHAFVSDEIVFGDGLDAEIKDVKVHGYAME